MDETSIKLAFYEYCHIQHGHCDEASKVHGDQYTHMLGEVYSVSLISGTAVSITRYQVIYNINHKSCYTHIEIKSNHAESVFELHIYRGVAIDPN